MISISFNIANPWSDRFKNLWCRAYKTPFKNKFIELELLKDSSIVSFMFRLAGRQSHGGLSIELGLLGYSFNFNFYDNRHWNYEDNRYFEPGEEYGQPD
jgi:hypothetical protein